MREARDAGTCVLHTGSDSLESLVVHLGLLGVDFEVTDPPELVEHIALLAGRYARAARLRETRVKRDEASR
jgi:hypothetical protein